MALSLSYNFPKIVKLKCREIWPLQIREIKVSRKFHVIRSLFIYLFIYLSKKEGCSVKRNTTMSFKGATSSGFRGFLAQIILKLVVAYLIHSEHYLLNI